MRYLNKRHRPWGLILSAVAIAASPGTTRGEAPVETWTSQAGTQVEAAFMELGANGMATLRAQDGEIFQIPASALDEAGQERVRELAGKQRDAQLARARHVVSRLQAIIPEAYVRDGDNELGRFESGTITAIVYEPSGRMDLFIKENGQYLSPPVQFSFSISYSEPDPRRPARSRRRGRSRVDWIEPPKFSGNTVRFLKRMEHDVEAELVYIFRPDGVDTGYRVMDPDGIQYASTARMGLSFPALFYMDRSVDPPRFYSPRVPQGTDRETFFAGTDSFEIRSGTHGRSSGQVIRHNQSVTGIGSGSWFELSGGVYGPHTLRIERPRRGGSLHTNIYRDNLPAMGWSMRFQRPDHSNDIQPADMLSVTVRR